MRLSFANQAQESVVGPFGVSDWLSFEGCSAAAMSACINHVGAAEAFAGKFADQFEMLVAGILGGQVKVDWTRLTEKSANGARILSRALAVRSGWGGWKISWRRRPRGARADEPQRQESKRR